MATTVRLELYVRSSQMWLQRYELELLGQDSRTDSMVSIFTLERSNRIDNQLMQLMPLFSVTSTFARTCSEGLVHLELQFL